MASPHLYISFHGGSQKNAWNNIHVFTLKGKKAPFNKAIDKSTLPANLKMSELRDFVIGPDNKLYLINAYKKYNQILRFKRNSSKTPFSFDAIFSEYNKKQNRALIHPFQLAFNKEQNLFVSCQDTNIVWSTYGPTAKTPGVAMPVASTYKKNQHIFLPGTFIPSFKEYSSPYSLKTVRGIAYGANQELYVADELLNTVNVFNGKTGAFIKTLVDTSNYPNLHQPVHLLFHESILYIGNKKENTILMVNTSLENPKVEVFIDNDLNKIDGPAGMCFTKIKGVLKFLLASRKSRSILQYNVSATGQGIYEKTLLKKLKDNPEFIKVF